MVNTNKLKLIFGNQTIGIDGNTFHYIFNYAKGGPESIVTFGHEWLYRIPRPTFWRATTDNDRGNGFSRHSAMWLGADLFTYCDNCKVKINNQLIDIPVIPLDKYPQYASVEKIEFYYEFITATVPKTRVNVAYLINDTGTISVKMNFKGKEGLPELPVLGLRMIMPTPAINYEYTGLDGETYPDRFKGANTGDFTISGLPVTPYLVPQDCQVHMATKRLKIMRDQTLDNTDNKHDLFGLTFQQDKAKFSFSCLPYTAEELENANHIEELPPIYRTVLCMYSNVRGVGGIDSWGTDVASQYHISAAEDHNFSFKIVVNEQ